VVLVTVEDFGVRFCRIDCSSMRVSVGLFVHRCLLCCVLYVQSFVGGCISGLGFKVVRVVWLSTFWTYVMGLKAFLRNRLWWCSFA
jgi:hypothetical protein